MDDLEAHDQFGIGMAMQHGLRMLLHGKRRTGRTTALFNAVREGDLIVCAMSVEAQRLRREARERGFKDVDVIYIDPRSLDEVHTRVIAQRSRRVVFDHTFFEAYYSYAVDAAVNRLARFQQDLIERRQEKVKPLLSIDAPYPARMR